MVDPGLEGKHRLNRIGAPLLKVIVIESVDAHRPGVLPVRDRLELDVELLLGLPDDARAE